MDIIYVDNYAEAEETALRNMGRAVATLEQALASDGSYENVILRGPKFKVGKYNELVAKLIKNGIFPTTSVDNYSTLSNSNEYEQSISEFVPKKHVFPAQPFEHVVTHIASLSSWKKVFIRSELGSAAKAGGIDACIISDFDPTEIERKLRILVEAFPSCEQVIARQVENVKKISEKNAEGRFVVLRGSLRYMDNCELLGADKQAKFKDYNYLNAELIANRLLLAGVSGDYFIDIAEKEDGGWFVVEIKPVFNGTIRDTAEFARHVARLP